MSATVIRFPASRRQQPASRKLRTQPSREQLYLDEVKRLFARASPKPKIQSRKEESLVTRLERVVTRLEQLTQMEN